MFFIFSNKITLYGSPRTVGPSVSISHAFGVGDNILCTLHCHLSALSRKNRFPRAILKDTSDLRRNV